MESELKNKVYVLVTPNPEGGKQYRPMFVEDINPVYNSKDEIIEDALWGQFSGAPVLDTWGDAYSVASEISRANDFIGIQKLEYSVEFNGEN